MHCLLVQPRQLPVRPFKILVLPLPVNAHALFLETQLCDCPIPDGLLYASLEVVDVCAVSVYQLVLRVSGCQPNYWLLSGGGKSKKYKTANEIIVATTTAYAVRRCRAYCAYAARP